MRALLNGIISVLVGLIGALVNMGIVDEETAAKLSDAIGAYGVMPIEE